MKTNLFFLSCLIAIGFAILSCKSNDEQFPRQTGFVNDYENILSSHEEFRLRKQLKTHENQTTNQIVIVTTSTILNFNNMRDYAFALANQWSIGTSKLNNGILIMLSKSKREIQIQNGEGIVEDLTDFETKTIIDSLIIPEFKKGNYYKGLHLGIDAIIEEIE